MISTSIHHHQQTGLFGKGYPHAGAWPKPKPNSNIKEGGKDKGSAPSSSTKQVVLHQQKFEGHQSAIRARSHPWTPTSLYKSPVSGNRVTGVFVHKGRVLPVEHFPDGVLDRTSFGCAFLEKFAPSVPDVVTGVQSAPMPDECATGEDSFFLSFWNNTVALGVMDG